VNHSRRAMIIERTDKEIILRLPADIGTLGLQRIIDYFKYREAVKGSAATAEDAERLAEESKARWWKENKHRFIGE
jgi:hypothetical protein